MSEFELISHSPEETRKIGTIIGEIAVPGDVLLLEGKLGAGKTCLTQGIALGLGIDDYVLSPTFVIMRELYGRLPLYHIDLYRVDDIEESMDLGLDDYFYGDGLSVVEWAEKAISIMPRRHLMIRIEYIGDTERRLLLEPSCERYLELAQNIIKGYTNN
ncbi:MAG: tRNA (adenosine(37)-N6)-threonylcarbamoyltransferase complex ATPase subunit type 1 TsaE [Chloroflexi bacterium RBG_13_46_14]|nr:MAG: tRNA (adenosine(37)-N6)-threonylcarbamoyltransferase complex ATPase subunit type 1 TsaE [Chloroflexi bacterium RBG_13_46_14]